MKTKFFVLALVASVAVACSSSKKTVSSTPEASKPEPLEFKPISETKLSPELTEGKQLFESKCGNCHDLPKPEKYSKEKWGPIMHDMQKAADITDAERDLVYNYVTMNL